MAESNRHPTPQLARDLVLQDLAMLRLEGRIFCFAKHALAKRAGVIEHRTSERDGSGDRVVQIEISRHGAPGPLAYRVLQAIYRKLTLTGMPDEVEFSYRELGRLVGRESTGGADVRELHRAVKQLESTAITTHRETDGKRFESLSMRILVTSWFAGEGTIDAPRRLEAMALMPHPLILDAMRQRRFAMLPWSRLVDLSPVPHVIAKRLFLVFASLVERGGDRAAMVFEKDYAAICGEWLGGLRVERYVSDAQKQLRDAFDALHSIGMIRSGEVAKRATGAGLKVVFRPGDGFFAEYERLFRSGEGRAPTAATGSARPLALVRRFYELLHGSQPSGMVYAPGDTACVRDLIEQIGEDGVQALAEFAVRDAKRTGFDMVNVRALATYRPKWEALRATEAHRLAASQARTEQGRDDEQRAAYLAHCRGVALRQIEQMTDEQREAVQVEARARVAAEGGRAGPSFGVLVRQAEVRVVQERFGVVSFNDWKQQQEGGR